MNRKISGVAKIAILIPIFGFIVVGIVLLNQWGVEDMWASVSAHIQNVPDVYFDNKTADCIFFTVIVALVTVLVGRMYFKKDAEKLCFSLINQIRFAARSKSGDRKALQKYNRVESLFRRRWVHPSEVGLDDNNGIDSLCGLAVTAFRKNYNNYSDNHNKLYAHPISNEVILETEACKKSTKELLDMEREYDKFYEEHYSASDANLGGQPIHLNSFGG